MIGKSGDYGPTPHERAVEAVYDAICEGRRQDAIDALQRVFPGYQFRSVAEQRNLFPERVPE